MLNSYLDVKFWERGHPRPLEHICNLVIFSCGRGRPRSQVFYRVLRIFLVNAQRNHFGVLSKTIIERKNNC